MADGRAVGLSSRPSSIVVSSAMRSHDDRALGLIDFRPGQAGVEAAVDGGQDHEFEGHAGGRAADDDRGQGALDLGTGGRVAPLYVIVSTRFCPGSIRIVKKREGRNGPPGNNLRFGFELSAKVGRFREPEASRRSSWIPAESRQPGAAIKDQLEVRRNSRTCPTRKDLNSAVWQGVDRNGLIEHT